MRLRLTRRAENRVEWQGSSQRLDRTVALKVLPAEVAGDAERRQRFEQEARAVAKLNHPNIVALYDMGTEHGVSFLVTELIEGESLRGASFSLRRPSMWRCRSPKGWRPRTPPGSSTPI